MAFKFVAFFGLLALANAGLLPVAHHGGAYIAAPAVHHVGHLDAHHEPAHYDFSYSVHDPNTGDVKEQQETRQGHSVAGHYSLVEPDGHRRTVHYTADEHNGFNAHVTREGSNVHVQHAAPVHHAVAPVAIAHHAAPVAIAHHAVAHHAAPVAIAHHAVAHHAAPVAFAHHVAPVAIAHHAAPVAIAHHGIVGHSAGHGVATSHSSVTHHDAHGVHAYHH